MPLILVQHYFRAEIQADHASYYVFGDNFARKGYGGQAGEARNEPNAIGIPTKRNPGWAEKDYLTDADVTEWREMAHPPLCCTFSSY